MKIGDYVRTKHYGISKITDIYNEDKIELDNVNAFGIKGVCYMTENIIKSSPNIIDVLQVGDFVNEYKITGKSNLNILYTYDEQVMLTSKNIKSVVTKEQFNSMKYKIGV